MTQPITVYPTAATNLYFTEDALLATPFSTCPPDLVWCASCTQLLETPSGKHWHIGKHLYCHRCVVVADEEEGL